MRWTILKENTGCSLYSSSHTCWIDRVDSVRPFAAHIPGIQTSHIYITFFYNYYNNYYNILPATAGLLSTILCEIKCFTGVSTLVFSALTGVFSSV